MPTSEGWEHASEQKLGDGSLGLSHVLVGIRLVTRIRQRVSVLHLGFHLEHCSFGAVWDYSGHLGASSNGGPPLVGVQRRTSLFAALPYFETRHLPSMYSRHCIRVEYKP